MSRPCVFACVLLAVSCSPAPRESRVWELSASDLYRSYYDYSDRWTGQRVRVTLGAGRYTVSGSQVHWHTDRQTDPPAVVFECLSPPVDSQSPVELTGVVRGRVESPGRWFVLVESVTVR